jgi:hypothetical protein
MAKLRSGRALRGLLLIALGVSPFALHASDAVAGSPFAPGETLTYDVTWSVFPAGEVTVTLKPGEDRSPETYETVTTARSQGFVAVLFDVENEFHSVFDPKTLCSRGIHKKIHEGRRRKDTRIVFDAERRLAVLDEVDLNKPNSPPKHAENDIPPCVADVVTAFYHVRKQPLRVGEVIHLSINDGAKTYDVAVEVQTREPVQTPFGKRDAFRVEPKVFGGLYSRQGEMLIWFSDDAQRLPLRIKASVSVGSITGTLRSVTTTAATGPPAR